MAQLLSGVAKRSAGSIGSVPGIESILQRMKDGTSQEVLGKKIRKVNADLFMVEATPPGRTRKSVHPFTLRAVTNLLTGGVLGDRRYYEPHHLPKWNVEPSLLNVAGHTGGGPLTRRVFSEMSKEEHALKATEFARRAADERRGYARALERAIQRYGDVPIGRHTSGIYNPDFPDRVKDALRGYLGRANDLTAASIAHHEAAGRRTPWRDTELRDLAYPPGSFY
jgi:hypothetical protein